MRSQPLHSRGWLVSAVEPPQGCHGKSFPFLCAERPVRFASSTCVAAPLLANFELVALSVSVQKALTHGSALSAGPFVLACIHSGVPLSLLPRQSTRPHTLKGTSMQIQHHASGRVGPPRCQECNAPLGTDDVSYPAAVASSTRTPELLCNECLELIISEQDTRSFL